MVTWFAGLFYLPRLFIYQVEASQKEEPERSILMAQLKMMQRKLWYIITWPGGVLTLIFGIWLLVINPYYLQAPWMHLKLGLVFILVVYHLLCGRMFNNLQKDRIIYSSLKLRLWNEVATILLFAIVFTVVLKDTLHWLWGIAGLMIISVILTLAVLAYKKKREQSQK